MYKNYINKKKKQIMSMLSNLKDVFKLPIDILINKRNICPSNINIHQEKKRNSLIIRKSA